MLTNNAISFFREHSRSPHWRGAAIRRLAEALNIKAQSVHSWGRYVPYFRQQELERITEGKLKAETLEQHSKRITSETKQKTKRAA